MSKQIGLIWKPKRKNKRRAKATIVREMPPIKSKWKALPPDRWPNYRDAKILSIDTETKDPNLLTHGAGYARHDGHMVGFSVAVSRKDFFYLPLKHEVKKKQNVDYDKALLWAKDNLEEHRCNKRIVIGANIQYDIGFFRESGIHVGGTLLDVQLTEKLINENRFSYSLDTLAKIYTKQGKISNKMYQWASDYYGGKADQSQRKNIYRIPPALVGKYGEADAWLPLLIWKEQKKLIKEQELGDVLDLECRFTRVLLDMRFRGVKIDIPYAEEMRERLIIMEAKVQKKLDKIAGKHIRFNAAASIEGGFLNLGLPYGHTAPSEKHPDGQASFTKVFLQNCEHDIADLILKVREINKIRGTFVESALLGKHIEGRVYGTFNQLGTRSGRLSAALPNLQQAPSRTTLGKELRRCFIPDGTSEKINWYRADVSQIQYRGLAHHAVGKGSDKVRRMYTEDPRTDFHTATQNLIKEVTGRVLERKPTKNINFGLCFGMMKAKLIRTLGLTPKKGNELFKAYHAGVPFVQATFDACAELVQHQGYVRTKLGRRSRFDQWCEPFGKKYYSSHNQALREIGHSAEIERAFAYKALVMLVQGEEADFIKGAMVKCYEDGVFDAIGGVPSLVVHDEIDGSCNLETDREALIHMKEVMQNSASYRVPILVDLEVGTNWRDCEKL